MVPCFEQQPPPPPPRKGRTQDTKKFLKRIKLCDVIPTFFLLFISSKIRSALNLPDHSDRISGCSLKYSREP